MKDSKVDKEATSTSIEHKAAKRQDQFQVSTSKKDDLEGKGRTFIPAVCVGTLELFLEAPPADEPLKVFIDVSECNDKRVRVSSATRRCWKRQRNWV